MLRKTREEIVQIEYSIGDFHVDIAEVRSEERRLYLFVSIDQTSKFIDIEPVKEYGESGIRSIPEKFSKNDAVQNQHDIN